MKERMLMVLGEHRSWQERENRFFACCSCSFRLPAPNQLNTSDFFQSQADINQKRGREITYGGGTKEQWNIPTSWSTTSNAERRVNCFSKRANHVLQISLEVILHFLKYLPLPPLEGKNKTHFLRIHKGVEGGYLHPMVFTLLIQFQLLFASLEQLSIV